ncbi:hypothetical protein ABEQ41_26270 [Priestia megaterium]
MVVKRYLDGEGSFKGIGDSIGVDEGDVSSWVQLFQLLIILDPFKIVYLS